MYPLMEKHLSEKEMKLTNNDRAEHQVCSFKLQVDMETDTHIFDR